MASRHGSAAVPAAWPGHDCDAAFGLEDGVAIAFAALGTGLVIFGGLLHRMEGNFEIGPQKFAGQLIARAEHVKGILERTTIKSRS